MKKSWLALTLVIVAPLVLVACKGDADNKYPSTTDVKEAIKRSALEEIKKSNMADNPMAQSMVDATMELITIDAVENCKVTNNITECDVTVNAVDPTSSDKKVVSDKKPIKMTQTNGVWMIVAE